MLTRSSQSIFNPKRYTGYIMYRWFYWNIETYISTRVILTLFRSYKFYGKMSICEGSNVLFERGVVIGTKFLGEKIWGTIFVIQIKEVNTLKEILAPKTTRLQSGNS